MDQEEPLLWTEGLTKYYDTGSGVIDNLLGRSQDVKAVDGVDLELYEGETFGVVGESGCGKSTLGRAMLRLLEPTSGSVYYRRQTDDGGTEVVDLTTLSGSKLRDLRTDLQYIFQDPFSSLNPRLTVGDIIGEPLDIHNIATGRERTDRIYELLDIVGLNPSHTERYPHEFSGGQRQRIGIARALAVDPEIIVCDEPVSALDVSVQAQILNLLEDLQAEFGLSYIFIAHDLSVVEHISDRIAVMYLGEFAEVGSTREVFDPPHHPYTEALLSAIPEPDPNWEGEKIRLSGQVPSPINPPSGCRFHTRCPRVIPPEGIRLDQSVWRAVLDLKLRIAESESPKTLTAVRELEMEVADRLEVQLEAEEGQAGEMVDAPDRPGEGDTDGEAEAEKIERNPENLAFDEFDQLVREEFGLPAQLRDPQVESTITEALELIYSEGNLDAAFSTFDEQLQSPCEVEHPADYATGETHEIACLLYDEGYARGVPSSDADVDDAAADD